MPQTTSEQVADPEKKEKQEGSRFQFKKQNVH